MLVLKIADSLIRQFFYWVSKLIRNYNGFASFRFVIGPENSHHAFDQSDAKP